MAQFGNKHHRLIAIFMIALIISITPIFALQISSVRVSPNTQSAVFTFNTDENATGFVQVNGQTYQETPSSFIKTHSVTVAGLNPDTTYNYKIVANNQQLQSAETAPSTFKTKATDGQLTFEANIASVVTNPFTITGKTTPDSFVTVYINGIAKKSTASDSTGNITFTNLFVDESRENEILIEVTQTGNPNKFTKTYKVTADNTVPLLTVIPPAEYASKSTVDIKGAVDEAVTLSGHILYASGTKADLRSTRVNAGNFTYSVTLDDGVNQITIVATDAAGNNAEYTTSVVVDKEDIKIIDTNLDELSPAFTTQLNVKGQVNKPGAVVRVYVDPNDRSIGPCREVTTITTSGVTSDDMCSGFGPWKAIEADGDYEEVTADAQGYFNVRISLDPRLAIFEKVGVTNTDRILTTSATTNNANDKAFDVDSELGTSERYKITVVAVDQYKRADSETRDITYAPCGASGEWSVRVGEVFPTILQPDHIMQGYAQISFKLDLAYFGLGQDSVSISGLSVRKNTDRSKYDLAELQEEILKSGNCIITPRSGVKDVAYVTCNLNKYPANAKGNYTKAYNQLDNLSSLQFPLKLSFGYTYTDESGGKSTIVQKSHESCIDVEVFLDKRLEPKQLPNGLLKGTVSAANSTVQAIDQILKPLKTVKLATLGACLGSKAYSIYSYTKEETACATYAFSPTNPARKKLEQAVRGCADASCTEVTSICDAAGDKQSDCMSCAEAISSRRNTEKFSNAVCDRIFCPAVPTASQYIKDVSENRRKSMSSACSRGENVWALGSVTQLTRESGCGLEYVNEWSYGCLAYDEFSESQKLAQKVQDPDNPMSDFAQTYDDVMDSLSFCSSSQKDKAESRDTFTYNKNVYYRDDFDKSGSYENDCFRLGSYESSSKLVRQGQELVATDTKTVARPAAVDYKGIPDEGQCLRTANDGTLILTPMGIDANNNQVPIVYDSKNVQLVKAKTDPEFPRANAQPEAQISLYNNGENGIDADGNYYKKTAAGEYQIINPRSDRDKFFSTVCKEKTTNSEADKYQIVKSGETPNNCVVQTGPEDLKNEKVRAVLIDPKESFINSFRCGCLPALEGYLMVIRNVLNAVKNCFNSVIVTGEFQAGACRSLLSQYLCDWIFNIIRCFTSAAGKLQEIGQSSTEGHEGGIGAIRALQQGSARMSQSMMDRYGDTTSYQSLISSRRLVHAACLAAFGYDWLPDLDQAVSIEGDGFTINSTAFVLTADRQYVASNPLNRGYATFIYETGYFISAGSNLDYSVELVCSNDNSCNPAEGFVGGTCDCAWGSSKGEKKQLVERGTAKGGQSVGDSDGKGQRFLKLTDQSIRYDMVRLTIRDRSNTNGGEQIFEKKIKNVGASMPATCSFNLLLAEFRCDYAVLNKYGDVYFYGQKVDFPKTTYSIGDKLNLAVYAKADYGSDMADEDGQIPQERQLPKYAQLTVTYGDRLVYKETSQKDAITLANGNPIVMGANYVVATGSDVKGLGGTYEIEGSIAQLSNEYAAALPADLDALALTRSNINQRIYVIYDGSKFRAFTQTLTTNTNIADEKSRLELQFSDLIAKASDSTSNIKEVVGIKQTAENNVYLIQIGNTQIRIPADRITARQSYSLIVTYSKVSTTSPVMCPPNVDQIELVARVTLHDSKTLNSNEEPTRYNSVMDPRTFTYNGEEQRIETKFYLSCKQTAAPVAATIPACAENIVLVRSSYPNDCSCGSVQKVLSTMPTGDVICNSYAGTKSPQKLCALDVPSGTGTCYCPPAFVMFGKYGASTYACAGTCKMDGAVNKCVQ